MKIGITKHSLSSFRISNTNGLDRLQSTQSTRRRILTTVRALQVRPYTTRKGDSLESIANKRGFLIDELRKLNHSMNMDSLEEGTTIVLPAEKLSVRDKEIIGGIGHGYRTYPVRKDETIDDIITKRHITMDEMKQLNPDVDLDKIKENMVLKLPVGKYTVRETEMLMGALKMPSEYFQNHGIFIPSAIISVVTIVSLIVCCESCHAFVAATILLRISNEFPSVGLEIEILNTRGLSEMRSGVLKENLVARVQEFDDEFCLVAICEAAKDVLDDLNTPEGNCCICLERLSPDQGTPDMDYYQQHLLLLPCLHAFHKSCFAHWWRQQQQELNAKEKELIEKSGAGALHVDLPKRHNGVYVLHCPVCRNCITTNDVDLNVLNNYETQSWSTTRPISIQEVLSPTELKILRQSQLKQNRDFQNQVKKGGIINESPFVLTLPPTSPSRSVNHSTRVEEGYR
eukprot:g8232.t1